MKNDLHSVWLGKMFDIIVEGHCRPCTRPEKQHNSINYENPLACDCRCDDVGESLTRAKAIYEAIDARGK